MKSPLNNEMENISVWLQINKLPLNIEKTHYMVFTRKTKIAADIYFSIDGNVITEVSSTDFLVYTLKICEHKRNILIIL